MKKSLVLLLSSALLLVCVAMPRIAGAETYNVSIAADSDCSDLTCDLRAALTAAANNGKDDVLVFSAGSYDMSTSDSFLGHHMYQYSPAVSENNTLTLQGAGAGITILDGAVTAPGMSTFLHADTTGLTADDQAGITIQNLSFRNANSVALSIHTKAAPVVLKDCEFNENKNVGVSAIDVGGALLSTDSGNITISNDSFINNASLGGWHGGGAFYTISGDVVVADSTFVGNSAKGTAGGFATETDSGALSVTGNVFYNNSANYSGGAQVYLSTGTGTVTNNTFSANTATVNGGGLNVDILDPAGTANVYNNILFGNTAGGNGADLYVWDNDNAGKNPATINLFNNDFSALFSTCLNDAACAPSAKTTQSGNQDADPLLIDPANGDFHLQATSTVIDQGLDAAPSLPVLDFEGDPRVLGAAPDMGADEFSRCGDGTVNAKAGEQCDIGNQAADTCATGTACVPAGQASECTCQSTASNSDTPAGGSNAGGSGNTDSGNNGASNGTASGTASGGCSLVRS